MKKFISIQTAVDNADKMDCLIPSAFLSVFPNNFGINLCNVKGFNVELQDDGQYKSIEVVFIPATPKEILREQDPECPVDFSYNLKMLEEQGTDIE